MARRSVDDTLRRMNDAIQQSRARRAQPWLHRPRHSGSGCVLTHYKPQLEGPTDQARNLSPSLRGCYADPVEWAMEVHGERLPLSLGDPGAFESTHIYDNPRDPEAWPKRIKVITLCRNGRARSFAVKPGEDLTVFPASELLP